MSKYTFPVLTSHKILYKGRRYLAFSVSIASPFEDYEEHADFVVWDGLYDAALAYGSINKDNGNYDGGLEFSHVEIEIDTSPNIKEFVKNTAKAQLRFFKDSGT